MNGPCMMTRTARLPLQPPKAISDAAITQPRAISIDFTSLIRAGMAILSFTLGPEAIGKIYDALVCLGRFSEAVCIESQKDHVCSNTHTTTCFETDLTSS
jgi:hypothetical protein